MNKKLANSTNKRELLLTVMWFSFSARSPSHEPQTRRLSRASQPHVHIFHPESRTTSIAGANFCRNAKPTSTSSSIEYPTHKHRSIPKLGSRTAPLCLLCRSVGRFRSCWAFGPVPQWGWRWRWDWLRSRAVRHWWWRPGNRKRPVLPPSGGAWDSILFLCKLPRRRSAA